MGAHTGAWNDLAPARLGVALTALAAGPASVILMPSAAFTTGPILVVASVAAAVMFVKRSTVAVRRGHSVIGVALTAVFGLAACAAVALPLTGWGFGRSAFADADEAGMLFGLAFVAFWLMHTLILGVAASCLWRPGRELPAAPRPTSPQPTSPRPNIWRFDPDA